MKSLLIFASLFLGSQAFAAADNLKVTLDNDQMILIDATTRSCALQINDPDFQKYDDVPSLFTSIGQFTINWTGPNNFRPQYALITLEGSAFTGGKLTLPAIAGNKLAYAIWGTSDVSEIASGVPTTSTSSCTFVVGGIQLTDKTKSASGQGTFAIYGTTKDSNGQTSAVSTSVPFNYEYFAP